MKKGNYPGIGTTSQFPPPLAVGEASNVHLGQQTWEMNKNDDLYRPCVGIMLINQRKKVFVARRIDTTSENWQMPQGGIDEGEEAEVALFRELMEEVGTDKAKVLSQINEWLYYDLPEVIRPKVWGGKYHGQRQRWYALQFTGQDSDINIQTHEPEFLDWKWVEPDQVMKLAVEFKRDIYSQVFKHFKHLLQS